MLKHGRCFLVLSYADGNKLFLKENPVLEIRMKSPVPADHWQKFLLLKAEQPKHPLDINGRKTAGNNKIPI